MTENSRRGVLLASGGLDSTTLAFWLRDRGVDVRLLFVDYGQHCAGTELDTLRHVLPGETFGEVAVVDLSDVYRGTASRLIEEADLWREEVDYHDLYLPYRSLLLLSAGAAFAQSHGYDTLYSAFINSNHAQEIDCSTSFFDQLATVLVDYGGVQVEMPFRDMSKVEVARIGAVLGAPIGYTYSCQASSEIPCGACPNCEDRLEALAELGGRP